MPLFDRYHLSQEEAEARLKRTLTGDPARGEIGLLAALSANKLDDVQGRLARDATLGQDLRDLVSEHLQKARARWETRRAWSVTLPLPVWDEYAREARITGRSITECLVSAIKRDYERKKGTLEPMETLDQNVRAFHAAATQLLEEARQVMERIGPLQEIGMRLSRIESAIGGRAVR
jgi:AcrR family transcriptional regulator